MNAEIKQLGHVRWISKHVFDRMWERGINEEEIKDTIKNGERAVDNQYGGYIYSSNGIKVCVTKSGGLKTVINKSTQNFKTSLGAILLEAKNAKKTN